ncbi:MAG: FIVAR domain-containing protein [Treponema sp.]|jgi:hypothetical protein|nr:FIVAR domain-containing protein [Treponema sp.]
MSIPAKKRFNGIFSVVLSIVFTALLIACPVEPDEGTPSVDKSALETAIQAAEELLDSLPISVDGTELNPGDGYITQDDYDAFKGKIDEAQTVFDDVNAAQAQINEAAEGLEAAKTAFESSIKYSEGVDFTRLETSVQAAEALLNSVKTLLDSSVTAGAKWAIQTDYTAFKGEIEKAKTVLENSELEYPEIEQPEINEAKDALDSAKAVFESLIQIVLVAPGPGSLVKFNAPNAVYNGTGTVNFGASSERHLVYPSKVDIKNDVISIQAKIKIISTSGHNGTGFISVTGSTRKGYMMLTAQNIKNDGTGASGQGMETAISWAAGDEYIFKSEINKGVINHYVYSTAGELVSQKANQPIGTYIDSNGSQAVFGHLETDTVYASIGGTGVQNMEWSDILVCRNGTFYTINALQEQSMLPSLSVSAATARITTSDSGSVTYTATAMGGAAAEITAVSADPATVRVDSFTDGTITFSGLKAGTAEITVTNTSDPSLTTKITVTVTEFPASDAYGALTTVYPATGESAAYTDGELMITFDTVPVLQTGGSIYIYDKTSGDVVDVILFADEKQTTLGYSNNIINVGSQLVRVDGNSLYFTPHFNKLEYGREYYVAIPKEAITAALNSKTFEGLSDLKTVASWSFATRAAPVLVEAVPVTVAAAHGSSPDFRTVYGALKAIAAKGGNWTINVAPGTYTELVHYVGSANVTINGTGSANYGRDVVIQYTNCNDMNGGTHTRPSFYFSGASLILKNLTLKNTTVRGVRYISTVNPSNNTQAETIYFANGTNRTMAAFNCSFLSHQDTIQTTGKNWFYKCYIEGDTDFIWGTADVCLLEDCELVCVKDPNKTNNNDTILLVARTGSTAGTVPTVPKGYVLFKSRVKVEYPMIAYFSRNPGAGAYYDQAAVIDTEFTLEGTIAPAIWNTSVYTYLEGAPEHVGWKLYNNTVDSSPQDVSEMAANTSVIAVAVYNLEYNGRRAILNRVYRKAGGYEPAASIWDVSALESDFGASPDASALNTY